MARTHCHPLASSHQVLTDCLCRWSRRRAFQLILILSRSNRGAGSLSLRLSDHHSCTGLLAKTRETTGTSRKRDSSWAWLCRSDVLGDWPLVAADSCDCYCCGYAGGLFYSLAWTANKSVWFLWTEYLCSYPDASSCKQAWLQTPLGNVTVSDLATVEQTNGPTQITHINTNRTATISGTITDTNVGAVSAAVQQKMRPHRLEPVCLLPIW